ncbi:MAG: N-acetylmuramoyl-L-alanine amidase [Candidatus Riflebacteria bacterium]
MPEAIEWNELVREENRFYSPNANKRRQIKIPTHIVLHITGTDDLASVKQTFLNQHSVSSHYLISKQGELFQFVPDSMRAYHAGIDSNTRKLYQKGRTEWQKYLKYFNWYKKYPKDSLFFDNDLKAVWDKSEAFYVGKCDSSIWSLYDYFNCRWPGLDSPVNFVSDMDPNNYSIGIEILGYGSKNEDDKFYTPAMYASLQTLLKNLSEKYSIPLEKGRVVGHEDVNPVPRFGWDPNQGFNWSLVCK